MMVSPEVRALEHDDFVAFVRSDESRWYWGFVEEWDGNDHLFVTYVGDRPDEAHNAALIPAANVTATWKRTSWDHTR